MKFEIPLHIPTLGARERANIQNIQLAVLAMPVSNYVIRRYTPPTCTLEILAQSSALSRWMGKSVLKQLRFELRFDDPQTQQEQRIAIRGDRDQLEALCTAVTNYVQELLQKPPENFEGIFSEFQSQNITLNEASRDFTDTTTVSNNPLKPYNNQVLGSDISLQPTSSLKHKLFLGTLANHVSGPVIQLSLLQLFDLATALDEYSADVLALPNLETPTAPTLSTWTSVAAVLVLGVALAPVTWQYANRTRQQQLAKKSATRQEEIALKPSPSPNFQLTPIPALTPPDQLPSVPQLPLGTNLPSSTPTANIPSPPSKLPTLPKSPISPILTSPQSAISSLPSTLQKSPQSTNIPSLGSKSSSFTLPTTSRQSPQSTLAVPGMSTKIPTSIPTAPNTASKIPSPQINQQPNLGQNTTGLIAKSGSVPETASIQPPSLGTTSGVTSSLSTTPSLSTLPELNNDNSRSVTGTALIDKLRSARKTPTEVATTTGTLFDTAQVAEARDFLKKRWQPPTQLKQAIEYSLVVSVDGSIERILPLGKSARDYIDRTGMPLIGERFVSPSRNGQTVKIRAVFSPDGAVKTFPEND